MADNDRHPGGIENRQAGHEEQDVNAIALTRFGIALSLIIIVALFGLWGLFNFFKQRVAEELGEAPPEAEAGMNTTRLPPEPRLQASPPSDLREMRAAEDKVLNHYGWVDQPGGAVHIPIDRAMEILVEKGLPVRATAPPPLGSRNNPTQSSAGPILQQPGGPLAPQLTRPPGAAEGSPQGTSK